MIDLSNWKLLAGMWIWLPGVGNNSYWVENNKTGGAKLGAITLSNSTMDGQSGQKVLGMGNMIALLTYILVVMNGSGLVPWAPAMTSLLATSMSWGMPMWLSGLILSSFASPKGTASHLTPGGAPSSVGAPVASVETLSTIIRPMTLSFRLSANISAGHVIMAMMSSSLLFSLMEGSQVIMSATLLGLITSYTMFELGISLAQAYVFVLLASMYSNDMSTVSY